MKSYRGHVINGRITISDPVRLPEGAEVTVVLVEEAPANAEDLSAVLLCHAGRGENLPADLAKNHDKYAHDAPNQ